MIKRLLFCIFVILIIIPIVYASSIGISPTNQKFFFEPNIKNTFNYKIYDSDPDQLVNVYLKGDLAEYANISITSFKGSAFVNLTIDLPEYLAVPGPHRILLGAVESESDMNTTSGVKGLAAIQVPIDIFVPYPGKYAETSFQIDNVNQGENTRFKLEINNLGTEGITVQPAIEVSGGNGTIISKILRTEKINSKDRFVYSDYINTSNLPPGNYQVNVNIYYGKVIIIKSEFKIGQLYINITDYSNEFEAKKVNKFYIELENLWNKELKNVYSEVSITSDGKILDKFKLSFIDLKPWEKARLNGFFDASNVSGGKYIANIKVFYENITTYKLAYVNVNNPPLDKKLLITICGVIVIFLILIIIIIFLIFKIKHSKKYTSKKYVKVKKK